jgi:hypothetical protein
MNNIKRNPASQTAIIPGVRGSSMKTTNDAITRIITFASRSITTALDANGLINALTPTIKVILMIVLPMTLVKASCGLPAITAAELATISGREVPIATIVRPIKSSETPNVRASFDADSTKTFEP